MTVSGVCSHGKRLYPSRKLARKAARRARGHHLREYRCSDVEGYWHIGHLPRVVMDGSFTATQVYRPNAPVSLIKPTIDTSED